ncbi:MAG: CoA-transferase, partial [Eubacterium sp.]
MKHIPVLTPEEAANIVQDGENIVTGGFVGSCCPETLTKALEKRFLEKGNPRNLTVYYAAAQGNRDGSGADHFAHKGMVKRVVGGHWNMVPDLGTMVINNEIEGYNLPQGTISQLFRDIAGKRLGTITHVGLNTFVDPRNQGGKLNDMTKEDIVELVTIAGQERLLYKAFPVNIAFLRGTYADEYGNITVEKEVASLESTSIAQAAKNSGGKV